MNLPSDVLPAETYNEDDLIDLLDEIIKELDDMSFRTSHLKRTGKTYKETHRLMNLLGRWDHLSDLEMGRING